MLKFLILILTLSFAMETFAAPNDIKPGNIKYVRKETSKREARRELQKAPPKIETKREPQKIEKWVEPSDITVNFNHGKVITQNGIVSQSAFKLSGIYPSSRMVNQTNDFPGNRGPGQLVAYMPGWGIRTGTNEFGKEAVVIDDTVVKITGADSMIPPNGYIISGHGGAKTWMNNNIRIGTKIRLDETTGRITAFTTVDSYRYQANAKIEELEGMLESAKNQNLAPMASDKKIKAYIKKAKQFLKKADGNDSESLAYAMASIEASNYTLSLMVPYIDNEMHGVWIRPTERSRAEIARTFDSLQNIGINAVFVETWYHGKTIYPSDVMRKYGFSVQNRNFIGFDPLAAYVLEAKKRNMQIHVWFESFYIGNNPPSSDPQNILTVKPMWGNKYKAQANSMEPVSHPNEHRGYFLDPANPEVITFLSELVAEITSRYNIDGVNLDYVRYPQSQKPHTSAYESSNWGYTDYARSEFKDQYEIDPLEIRYGSPMWHKWDTYRQNKIANYVSIMKNSIQNKGTILSAVVFPLEEGGIETKQQNWGKWVEYGTVDALTPLILTSDPDLAQQMLRNIRRKASKTKIYSGLFVGFMDGEPEDLLRQIRAARLEKIDGMVLFDYAHLGKKYVDVLKACTFSTMCK